VTWGAANARARGLATHLLDRPALMHAAGAGSWAAAIRPLVERGYALPDAGAELSPEEFDRATGEVQLARLRLLGRWLGKQGEVLAILFEDESRRTLRALLRGAAQGASPEARLRGLSPTPGLPRRTIDRLARAESPALLAEALVRMGHPGGRALAQAARHTPEATLPGLWRLETALSRTFALRATRAARHGGKEVRRFVALLIDLENAGSLLLARDWGAEIGPDEVFLPGGTVLDRTRFAALAAIPDPAGISAALEQAFAHTPLARIFGAESTRDFDARAASALLEWLRHEARRNPLGPGVVLWVLQRIRAEARDLRFLSAAVQLGMPPARMGESLVTPV
jgi:vacuolar-type H+-ATPase subunit C/Vma6